MTTVRSDVGALVVHAAAELPDGRMLVALGEVGAWLLSREGRVVFRFAEPAHKLVISDHGDRAILVAFRGEACRLARLDLLTRRISSWCDARISRFASNFDGATWHVSFEDTVFAIDALCEGWEHIWTVEAPGSFVSAIARDAKTISVWFDHNKGADGEVWTLDASAHVLRQRRLVPGPGTESTGVYHGNISAAGLLAGWVHRDEEPTSTAAIRARAGVFIRDAWKDIALTTPSGFSQPQVANDWIAFSVASLQGTVVHLYDSYWLQERAVLKLDRAIDRVVSQNSPLPAGLRFQGDRLLVFDDCGRVLVFSLKSGTVLREFRIS